MKTETKRTTRTTGKTRKTSKRRPSERRTGDRDEMVRQLALARARGRESMRLQAIARAAHVRPRNAAYDLRCLVRDGRVVRIGHDAYALPSPTITSPSERDLLNGMSRVRAERASTKHSTRARRAVPSVPDLVSALATLIGARVPMTITLSVGAMSVGGAQ